MSFRTSVEYQELNTSLSPDIHRVDASSDVRKVLVNWEDATVFVKEILGGISVVAALSTYIPPDRHPTYPQLWADSCKITGLGLRGLDTNNIIKYEKAEIAVTYTNKLNQDNGGDAARVTYITEQRTYSTEYQQTKGLGYYHLKFPFQYLDWLNAGGVVPYRKGTRGLARGVTSVRAHRLAASDIDFDDPVGDETKVRILIPKMELSIVIHWWHDYPDDDIAIAGLTGMVNADYYKPLLTTYPPHSLLFVGLSRERQYTNEGISAWQLEFKFLFNPNGWNTAYVDHKFKTDPVDPRTDLDDIDRDWPPGFYIIATSDDPFSGLIFPYTPITFNNMFLPHGFRPLDFGSGDEIRGGTH